MTLKKERAHCFLREKYWAALCCVLYFCVTCLFVSFLHFVMSFCSHYSPSGSFSHLVCPKGETTPLSWPFSAHASPFQPELLVAEAVQTARRPLPPSHSNTKAAFTSAFWWPSEGNVIIVGCSMLYHRVTVLYLALSQVLDPFWGVLILARTQFTHLFLYSYFFCWSPRDSNFSFFITGTVTCAIIFSKKEKELNVFLQIPPECAL